MGSIIVLVNAFFNAINYNLQRMLREIHFAIPPFYYGALGTCVSIILIIKDAATHHGIKSSLGSTDYIIFFCIGASSALGALFKSLAFHYEKVTTLSLLKYTSLVYSLLADLILFNVHIYTGEIIGATVIFISNIFMATLKVKQIS